MKTYVASGTYKQGKDCGKCSYKDCLLYKNKMKEIDNEERRF